MFKIWIKKQCTNYVFVPWNEFQVLLNIFDPSPWLKYWYLIINKIFFWFTLSFSTKKTDQFRNINKSCQIKFIFKEVDLVPRKLFILEFSVNYGKKDIYF